MTITIGDRDYATPKEAEEYIKSKGMDDVQAQKTRLALQREVFMAHREQALAENPGLSKLGGPISAAANFGNQVALGAPNAMAAAVTAPFTAANRGIGLGDAFELNRERGELVLGASPKAQMAGTVAAFFTPGSGAKAVANLGFKVAGGAKLARIAAESSKLGTAAAAQLASAMTGGAGAITAINLSESVFNERSTVEAVSDSLRQIKSPTNFVIAFGGAGLASTIRAIPDQGAVKLVDAAKRLLPGFKATPDMLRPEGGFLSGLVDSLKVSPAGRKAVAQYLRTSVYQPLGKAVDDIKRAITPPGARRGDLVGRAAKDIRNQLVSPKGEAGEGILSKRMKAAGSRGFGAAARDGDMVSRSGAAQLLRTFRALEDRARKAGGTEGSHGSEYSEIIKNLRGVIRKADKAMKAGGEFDLTPQMLDNLRQRLGPIASFDAKTGGAVQLGARDIRDAKSMYMAIREVQRLSSSSVDNALRDIRQLRQVQETFRPLVGEAAKGDDIGLVRKMFEAPDFKPRWANATEMLKEPQLQRIRGAYFAEFLEELTLRRGVRGSNEYILNESKMYDMFRGKGGTRRYRAEVFDAVLPGIRGDVTALAEISDLVARTSGKAEGSATAKRVADMAAVAGAVDTVKMAVAALQDAGIAKTLVGRLLSVPGVLVFTESLLTGRVADVLNRAASGGTVQPGTAFPAAAASSGITEGTDNALSNLF